MTVLIRSISCLSNSAHSRYVDSHEWESGSATPTIRMECAKVPNWRNQMG
jgi:hypothetical protein